MEKPKPRSKTPARTTTTTSNSILKKQSLLNNNNIVKNLNETTTAGGGGTASIRASQTPAPPRRRNTLPPVTPAHARPPHAPAAHARPPHAPQRTAPAAQAHAPEPDLPQGCTPLMYACQQADERLVAELIRKEPSSVLKRDRTLKTALHYCFDNPTAATADRIVMAAPALIEARDQDGFTPLHLAVIQGNMPLVTFLLANNADVAALDNERHSVVHWATVCGELEALRAVLSAGADPSTADIHGGYPLHYAAQMCGGGASGGATGTGAGAGGARLSLEVLATLLRATSAKVDALDGQGRQPLLWAASAGSAPAILSLVKAGAAVEAADKDGLTALHCAASRGHTECIETLLTLCGARPDVIDSNGCTALHYAVTLGHADATMLLLDHGSDPNRQDRKGRSPAHCGCAKGQLETVRMLAARGANVWLRNAKGDLPLHEAVASGRRELVKWLLEIRPSQVNATNNDGRTLLHIAANTDNTDLCKIILDFGGEINPVLRTSKNILMTPLDCALHKGYRSTAKYLQMHGGLPASRLGAKHAMVNQETIPQLPVRHIKSTKINLRDNIAIERREIFEMSPGSTPKHKRYSAREGSVARSSAEESSEDYEVENKRKREERRKHKKYTFKYKKERLKTAQNSFSDGYEGDLSHRKRSSRPDKSLSDSEGSAQTVRRKKKRSKSEPSDKVHADDKVTSASRKKADDSKQEAAGSDHDKKKRRKTSTPKERATMSVSSSDNNRASTRSKADQKSEAPKTLEGATVLDDGTNVNDIIDNIENSINKLDQVMESRLSDTEANTMSFIQTTLVTEAQVHMESRTSVENDFNEHKVVTIERLEDNIENASNDRPSSRPDVAIEYVIKDDVENEDGNFKEEEPKSVLIEKHAEIREEKIESETLENELDLRPRDSIIAIIPDIDQGDAHQTTQEDESQKESDEKNDPNYVQAIMGILPDDEQNLPEDTKDSQESVLGDDVTNELDPNRAIVMIDAEMQNSDKAEELNDSEELIGVREISFKSKDGHDGENDIENENPDYSDDRLETATVVRKGSFQKAKRKSSIRSMDDAEGTAKNAGKELYETESYKVLGERFEEDDYDEDDETIAIHDDSNRFVKHTTSAYSRRRRLPSSVHSDNETYPSTGGGGIARRRRLRKRTERAEGPTSAKSAIAGARSKSQNSDRDYESSSFFVDSGFEPSPRFVGHHRNRPMSPRLVAYYEDRENRKASPEKGGGSRIPTRKPGDRNAVDMTSVTQRVQTNMRRYFLERKIFQHLMELKRIQIRSSKANEAMLVKRAVDEYHRTSLAHVGAGRYGGSDFTFKSFERFLYETLRRLQRSGGAHLRSLPESAFDEDWNSYRMHQLPDNPALCTNKTHRCYHAVHAYTGIPCSAYIPMKQNHHTMPKPNADSKRGSSFLPEIKDNKSAKRGNGNSQVTLELCHGNEKQMIALPAEKLNKNKRYYVTFTVKGQNSDSDNKSSDNAQRNVKRQWRGLRGVVKKSTSRGTRAVCEEGILDGLKLDSYMMSDDDPDIDIESDEGDDSDSRSRMRQSSNIGGYFSQAEKRAHHNALERKRRDHIKDSFTSLRESVPALQGEKVASRAQILKKAAEYIQFMRRKNVSHQQDIDDLKRQNNSLENQIKQLERAKASGNYLEAGDMMVKSEGSSHGDTDSSDGEGLARRSKKLKIHGISVNS